jgi:hypothetical protein
MLGPSALRTDPIIDPSLCLLKKGVFSFRFSLKSTDCSIDNTRMSIADYITAQRSNLASIMRLPQFGLIDLVDKLYDRGIDLVKPDSPPRYGKFLLLAHQSFLSAATLIAQAQPFDAGPITRRAIEIARVCLASKYNIREKLRRYARSRSAQ